MPTSATPFESPTPSDPAVRLREIDLLTVSWMARREVWLEQTATVARLRHGEAPHAVGAEPPGRFLGAPAKG